MNTITLNSSNALDVTIISNVFIDTYMPSANGDYVKVYLYLLRCTKNNVPNLSISFLADRLDNTEKDIIRALNYWEKVSLITLTKSSNNEISGITLIEPFPDTNYITESQQSISASKISSDTTEEISSSPTKPDRPVYTSAQITELTNNEEIKWIMNIIEIYLERLLKPKDIQLILYLYENVGFSAELIMYLYEYCVSKNKRNTSYIEAVALSWAESGVDTIEKAESSCIQYNTNYSSINKAFGLNRIPGAIERQYMDKWINTYHFDIEIIVEACNRTLLNTNKPDFKYADKILENWKNKNVKNRTDITALDMVHNSTKKAQASKSQTTNGGIKSSNNQFNSFPQRAYTAEDYSSLEKRLLNK